MIGLLAASAPKSITQTRSCGRASRSQCERGREDKQGSQSGLCHRRSRGSPRKQISRKGRQGNPKVVVLVFLCDLCGLCAKNGHTNEGRKKQGFQSGLTTGGCWVPAKTDFTQRAPRTQRKFKSAVNRTGSGFPLRSLREERA